MSSTIYKVVSWIHIIFVFSIAISLLTIFSAGFLLLPLLAVCFVFTKELLYEGFDPHIAVLGFVKEYLKKYFYLMKYSSVYIIFLLNIIGILLGYLFSLPIISFLCSGISLLCIIFLIYIATYAVFIEEKFDIFDPFVLSFYKVSNVFILAVYLIVLVFLNQSIMAAFLPFMNFVFFFVIGIVVSKQAIEFKIKSGKGTQEDLVYMEKLKNGKN